MANIVETAKSVGSFQTLLAALAEANLEGTLSGPGPFTVFAPSDEAFAKLPADTIEKLLADKQHLVAILNYHVVPGTHLVAEVVKSKTLKSAQGNEITVENGETVTINGVSILETDIITDNGVIHVIDGMLSPR